MKYRLLALDVDGTLVGPDNVVSPQVAEAVAAAEKAGLGVCVATGRSYGETAPIWRQLGLSPPYQPMILIGGALVSEPDTGRSLYHKPIPHETAVQFADALSEAGYCAMAIVDAWRHDVEYFVTEAGDVDEIERRWFSQMDVKMQRVRRLADPGGPEAPNVLRISTVVEADRGRRLAESLRRRFDGALGVHFILAPNYGVTIVEAHAAGADKSTALRYIAQAARTPPARVVAVGDDINDIAMLRGAGLGVAMPGAPESVLAAADHVAEGGLAKFVHQLIDGRFAS